MIQEGDLVRLKNSKLRASEVIGPFNRTRWKHYKRFRGKQIICRVVRVEESYDWRSRRLHRLVTLDIPDPLAIKYGWSPRLWQIDASYVVVHRKFRTSGAVTAQPKAAVGR